MVAQFWIPLHAWFYLHPDEHLGRSIDVSLDVENANRETDTAESTNKSTQREHIWRDKWRNRRLDILLPRHLCRLCRRHCLHGRDGFHGAHCGRAISLGFRIRACRWQQFLSYVTGWICVLGWQTGITSIAFLTSSQIQSLVVINNPSYVFERWHTTLLILLVSFFAIIFNTYLAKRLPLVEGIILVLHICGFFAILIPLWVMAPRSTASEVFGTFNNGGGWSSIGLSILVGMLSPVFTFIGPDSATHVSFWPFSCRNGSDSCRCRKKSRTPRSHSPAP